jgi:DNA-binding LacI/PurR family transcriptional regulator
MPSRPRQRNGQRVTSADVAAAAGVSRATVSYVLNGVHDRISERTRERVYDAAERLGYVPNAVASALRAGRTEIVLLALPPWPLGPAVAEWVSAGVVEFERLGYTPLVHLGHGGDPRGFVRACDRVRPVGLIAPGEELPPARATTLRENGTLGVLAISPEPLEHVMTLVFRQSMVGDVAISHLLERGHERIVVLLPSEPEFAGIAAGRLEGAQAAAAEGGATVFPVQAPCDPDAIAAALAPVLAQRPTALFGFNDDYALAALDSLPDGIAVIGCDDSAPARRAKLTSILLADPSRWKLYVARLHAMIEGDESRDPITDRPKLVRRAST